MNRMKRFFLIALLLWVGGWPAVHSAMAQADEQPVVRGVLFWSDTCPHCHYVLEEVLPPLQEQYGEQLDIVLVELNSEETARMFYAAGAAAGLEQSEMGVPLLIVGEYLMMGSAQIPEQLPGLVEHYLAAGGVELPPIAGLEALAGPAEEAAAPSAPVVESKVATEPPAEVAAVAPEQGVSGSVPAFVLLVGMALALLFVGAALALARMGKISPPTAAWMAWAIPVLAVLGLFVAGYLTYVETQTVEAVCGPVGDCNTVQSSPYARLFGVPVGLIGVAGYLAMLGVWLWGRSGNLTARWLLLAMAAGGVAFSVYLTYLELFVIYAVCMWCLSSAAIMMLILLAAAAWLADGWRAARPLKAAYRG